MNKGELIDAIAAGSKLTKADAGRALDATLAAITKTLKKGDKVTLVGFGTFSTAKRAARTGRNPQTGKAIKIAAKKVAKFKAGADLSKTVNKSERPSLNSLLWLLESKNLSVSTPTGFFVPKNHYYRLSNKAFSPSTLKMWKTYYLRTPFFNQIKADRHAESVRNYIHPDSCVIRR